MTIRWEWELDPGPARIDDDLLAALRSAVDQRIDAHQDRFVDDLRDLIRFPTISGAPDSEGQRAYRHAMDDCLAYVADQAKRLGMAWREHEGMAAVAEWAADAPDGSLGIAAHLDVVPPGGAWQHPPFDADIVDGEIWGRGTQDDKGPISATFAALEILQELGLEPRKDIRLMFGTLEETDDWPDMDLLLEREPAPDLTLVPDGAFPVIVGEKGIMTVAWNVDWPPDARPGPRFVALRAGERHNVVPAEARIWIACGGDRDGAIKLLEEMGAKEIHDSDEPPPAAQGDACVEGRFTGTAAHGAFPADGDNAALTALEGVAAHFDQGPGRFARFLLQHCSDLDGAGLDLDEEHTHMGEATINLGIVEMGPQHGHAQVNIRFPIGLTIRDVRRRFEDAAEAAEGLRITAGTRGRPQDPIFVSPEDHPLTIHALQAAYQASTGREPHLASLAGTTYAKIFPLAMAYGPQDDTSGEPILAHQVDERVSIQRHLENIRIYALAVALLAFDEEDLRAAVAAQHAAVT